MGVSMLMLALYYEQPAVAKEIRGFVPELSFFEAVSMGEARAVRAALQGDPGLVNGLAPDGFPALGLAIFFRQPEVARILIDAGADVNLRAANAAKVAPIHAACARQDLAMLQLLLEHGADPKLAQDGGFTPLDTAKQTGNLEMETLLLAAGA